MANYIEAMWNYVYRQQEEKIKMYILLDRIMGLEVVF